MFPFQEILQTLSQAHDSPALIQMHLRFLQSETHQSYSYSTKQVSPKSKSRTFYAIWK